MSVVPMSFMDSFNATLDWITNAVFYAVDVGGASLPLIVVWLIIAGCFFTVWMGFTNVRGFKHAIDLVRGRYAKPDDAGEVSHFQALATALSGTVGLGNIAGVAVAISIGGPGATLWMILAALLGMSTKLVECTLGVKFRHEHADGTVSGGPMYYMRDGIAKVGFPTIGKVLAVCFAVAAMLGALGGGNMVQSNQAATQLVNATGGNDSPLSGFEWLIGVVIAIVVGAVIIGGLKGIARVTEKVVPFMGIFYVLACVVVIFGNLGSVPEAIGNIFSGAFAPEGVSGGILGALIVGFQRSAFSNEAGVGSAATAHSAVRTTEPATEGHVALLEPFIDTVIICTMTALTITISGVYVGAGENVEGVSLTSAAFETVFPWFGSALAIAVLLFAFSTILSWSYYGMKACGYLFGDSKLAENVFKVVFCLFIVFGAGSTLDSVLGFGDAMIFTMAFFNIIGLYFLAGTIKREFAGYRAKLRSGEFARVK